MLVFTFRQGNPESTKVESFTRFSQSSPEQSKTNILRNGSIKRNYNEENNGRNYINGDLYVGNDECHEESEYSNDGNNTKNCPNQINTIKNSNHHNEKNSTQESSGLPKSKPNSNKDCPIKNSKLKKKRDKVLQALQLPSVMNINPRSAYNKPEELQTLIIEEDVDCTFLSESWERSSFSLEDLLSNLKEEYQIISNPHARTLNRPGGRPAIIIRKHKYTVKNLTNTIVNIPWRVEATWAAITPLNITHDSIIKKIILCSFYYPGPHSKTKTLLLDHISQTFHLLTAKYGSGTHFILCADANKLDLSSIIKLSPSMKQLVTSPTRLSPPAMLICLPPLAADHDKQ